MEVAEFSSIIDFGAGNNNLKFGFNSKNINCNVENLDMNEMQTYNSSVINNKKYLIQKESCKKILQKLISF